MRFKNCDGQIARWIETLSAYTFIVVHRAGRVHNNADSMSRRPCHNDQCKYCDRYERRYSPYILADLNKPARKLRAVKKLAVSEGNAVGETGVTLPCVGGDCHAVVYPNDGNDHGVTLSNDGTIRKHMESVSLAEQDEDPVLNGPSILDDNLVNGGTDQSTSCLEPRSVEVSSLETSYGMSKVGDPRCMGTADDSVHSGVDAESYEVIESCQLCCCCCCCCGRTACYDEDWMDQVEDSSLFGCLFENGMR